MADRTPDFFDSEFSHFLSLQKISKVNSKNQRQRKWIINLVLDLTLVWQKKMQEEQNRETTSIPYEVYMEVNKPRSTQVEAVEHMTQLAAAITAKEAQVSQTAMGLVNIKEVQSETMSEYLGPERADRMCGVGIGAMKPKKRKTSDHREQMLLEVNKGLEDHLTQLMEVNKKFEEDNARLIKIQRKNADENAKLSAENETRKVENQELRSMVLQLASKIGIENLNAFTPQLVNHDTPESLRAVMLDALKEFFDLPIEEKREYEDKDVMDPIRYGTSFNTNVEEVRYWRDYLKVVTHPKFNSPTKPLGLRETLQEYSTIIREIAIDLLKGIWESLSLEESFMKEALGLDSCWQIVVGNLYPPCPQPELALGLPSHSDYGLLSILHTNGVPGLEVKHSGKWVQIKPIPNAYLVNIGDHMEITSNGRYKSLLHRASLNNQSLRMSIVALIGPSLDTIVVPAPQLVDDESRPTAFHGIKFGDFVKIQQSSRLKEKSILDSLRLPKGE